MKPITRRGHAIRDLHNVWPGDQFVIEGKTVTATQRVAVPKGSNRTEKCLCAVVTAGGKKSQETLELSNRLILSAENQDWWFRPKAGRAKVEQADLF